MLYKEYKRVISVEKHQYRNYMFASCSRYLMAWFRQEPIFKIMQWQVASRWTDYYFQLRQLGKADLWDKLCYIWYSRKRNKLALRLGIEIDTLNIGEGLLLYHYGTTAVNGNAGKMGKNLHLHGNNCIGNNGLTLDCPTIGDNVMVGVGAKIIGPVRIANNIKIAAGAVVVTSFDEEGITIGGVPARRLK